jgi:hypothetical protein
MPILSTGTGYIGKPKTTAWTPAVVAGSGIGPRTAPKPTYTPPQPVVRPPQQQQQSQAQSGGGGSSTGGSLQNWMAQIQGMMPQTSGGGWTPPAAPQEPQVTQSMIAEWQKRAMEEAGLTYDPQILSIQQQLDKSVLSAQQAKGGIAPSYQEVLDNISKWQEDTTKAEQGRAYARGFGQGGGLMQTETDVAKEALKQQTGALTEKARAETNIDAQIQQLQEQAGAQITGAESAKAKYVSTRRSDLEDSYKQNKAQLDQNKFANEMQIAQFGLTKESENFTNWLNSMSLATDMWYKDQSLSLDKMAQELGVQANTEALNWDKEKFNTTNAINAANKGSGAAGNDYENMVQVTLKDGQKVWVNGTTAWQMELAGQTTGAPKPSGNAVGSAASNLTNDSASLQAWMDNQALTKAAADMGNTGALKKIFSGLESSVY